MIFIMKNDFWLPFSFKSANKKVQIKFTNECEIFHKVMVY